MPLSAPLLAAAAWLGLDLLASRLPKGCLGALLLRRARLSVALTLLVAGWLSWLQSRLEAMGWDWPGDPAGARDALLTLGVMWTLLRLKATLLRHLAHDGGWWSGRDQRERAAALDLMDKTVTGVVALLGGLAVLKLLGVSAAVLLTASGLGAAALGFGAKTLVENLLSGLMIYLNRPFAVGDQIELPSQRFAGRVRAIGLFNTELLTPDGEPLYLPNGLFTHSAVVNSSRRPHRRLALEVDLEPMPRGRAEAIVAALRQWLADHGLVRREPASRVAFTAFMDGALRLRVECATESELEGFQALRQDLLLEIGEQVVRHGGALAGLREPFPPALKSAPGGGGPP
ncbi:MAG: mechanosensitive ion channel family protein [Cyanobacteriota bacterium]|nr:mechanosensitive ion channel family protein [Cyanobacteriota bacterium]